MICLYHESFSGKSTEWILSSVNSYMSRAARKKPLVKNSQPNLGLAVRENNFHLPQQFLNALNEFSCGGYVLILGNSLGDPHVYTQFDGGIQGRGLTKFGKDFFCSLDRKLAEEVNAYTEMSLADEGEGDDDDAEEAPK